MPPKAKGKKKPPQGRQSAAVDGLSTEEMNKDQLEEHIIRLREELDREREERSYFQLERDKIRAFWEICRRRLQETQAELRTRDSERREAEERHRVEITVYKQKLKHVLSEQHNTVSRLKTDNIITTSKVQNRETELELQGEVHNLQEDYRKKVLDSENTIKELKLKHQVELMELSNDYDRRIRDMAIKYHRNMESALRAMDKRKQKEVQELEGRWRSQTEVLVDGQLRALRQAESVYAEAQREELQQLNQKEQLLEVKVELQRREKKVSAAEQEDRRLHHALQEAEQKLPEIQEQLQEQRKAKTEGMKSFARAKAVEEELRDLNMEHELLLQAFEKVQQERDELLRRQTETILEVQQRCGLKEMLLQRKMAALTEALERKEAQLCATLSASNIYPTAAGNAATKLEETLEADHLAVGALEDSLSRDCEDYDQLLHTSREQQRSRGVPLHGFLFRPSNQIIGGQTHSSAAAAGTN